MEGISLKSISPQTTSENENPQQQYFNWMESRIANFRFKADPGAIVATAHVVKNLLIDLIDKSKKEREKDPAIKLILQKFFLNLPQSIRTNIGLDQNAMNWLGIRTLDSLNIGNLSFIAYDFWSAVKDAHKGKKIKIKALQADAEYFVDLEQGRENIIALKDNNGKTITSLIDDIIGLLVDSPEELEKILNSHRHWFDCDSKTYKRLSAEILLIEDPPKRIEEVYNLRQASGSWFYEKLKEKIIKKASFSFDELIPTSLGGLIRHYRLSATEHDFSRNIENAAKTLLADEGLKVAIIRLSCIPVRLSKVLIEEFRNLSIQEQCDLLVMLKSQCVSPLCKLHLLDLSLNCSGDKSFVIDYANELLNELLMGSDIDEHFELFESILNWVNNELSYLAEIKHWPISAKIALLWAHTNSLYNIFIAGDISAGDLAKSLNKESSASTEIVMRDQDYCYDVLHPKRFNKIRLLMDGLANILLDKDKDLLIDIKLAGKFEVYASKKENMMDIVIFTDALLMKDNLCSLLGGDRGKHLSIFDPKISEQFSSEKLRQHIEDAINLLDSDPKNYNEWLKLATMVSDFPIYSELLGSFEKLLKKLDIESFIEDDPSTALLALRVAATQIVYIDNAQIRSQLENMLFSITKFFSKIKEEKFKDSKTSLYINRETIASALIVNALYISLKQNSPSETSRNFSRLAEQIFYIWPLTANVLSNIFRFAQELPAQQLHGIWPLILANRAMRKN